MTPAIVTENGLRIGNWLSGGSTIISTVLQVVLNVLEYNMDAGVLLARCTINGCPIS